MKWKPSVLDPVPPEAVIFLVEGGRTTTLMLTVMTKDRLAIQRITAPRPLTGSAGQIAQNADNGLPYVAAECLKAPSGFHLISEVILSVFAGCRNRLRV